ncbi:MAG TPA: hypothetical protein VIT64_02590, partial [Ilumatobacteraceae bacterium]
MITRTATLFSLAGVLVAGSAAALVNSQVLQDSSDPTSDPSSILLATSTTQPQATSTVTAVSVAPSTATTVAGAPASTLSVFSVGDAGVVSTDSAGGVLVLASAVPNPGWAIASSGTNGFGGVGVTFRSAEVEVVFNAVLVDGQVVTSVGSSFIDTGTNTSIDDDHDDSDDRRRRPGLDALRVLGGRRRCCLHRQRRWCTRSG